MLLLAIETSCDESAVALLDVAKFHAGETEFLAADLVSSQAKLHEPYGGVVPELAAREHTANLPLLVNEALRGRHASDIGAVAVTRGPGLKGCLLVGLSFAKALAYGRKVPLIPIHHLEGHLLAGHLGGAPPKFPMLALVVSGGHTLLVVASGVGKYRVVASTRDDAAGEAFDKTATLLGLPYPGGPVLASLARTGDPKAFQFPIALADDPSSFSFSGLKTAVLRTVDALSPDEREARKADLAASIECAIVETLVRKTVQAEAEHKPKSILVTGGVAANTRLRSRLRESLHTPLSVPEPKWCTDNAAMIAVAAACRIGAGIPADTSLSLSADPRWAIDSV